MTKKQQKRTKRRKKSATKPERRPERRLTLARTRLIARIAKQAATDTCLEMPAAVALVKGCLGGVLPGLDTKLGDLFPDPDARAQFCQCVADGAGVSRAQIPCSEGTTVGEAINAIAC